MHRLFMWLNFFVTIICSLIGIVTLGFYVPSWDIIIACEIARFFLKRQEKRRRMEQSLIEEKEMIEENKRIESLLNRKTE